MVTKADQKHVHLLVTGRGLHKTSTGPNSHTREIVTADFLEMYRQRTKARLLWLNRETLFTMKPTTDGGRELRKISEAGRIYVDPICNQHRAISYLSSRRNVRDQAGNGNTFALIDSNGDKLNRIIARERAKLKAEPTPPLKMPPSYHNYVESKAISESYRSEAKVEFDETKKRLNVIYKNHHKFKPGTPNVFCHIRTLEEFYKHCEKRLNAYKKAFHLCLRRIDNPRFSLPDRIKAEHVFDATMKKLNALIAALEEVEETKRKEGPRK